MSIKATFEGFLERSRLEPHDSRDACGKLILEATNVHDAEVLAKFLEKLIGCKRYVGLPTITKGEGTVDPQALKW